MEWVVKGKHLTENPSELDARDRRSSFALVFGLPVLCSSSSSCVQARVVVG